jgi:hypothetical protein
MFLNESFASSNSHLEKQSTMIRGAKLPYYEDLPGRVDPGHQCLIVLNEQNGLVGRIFIKKSMTTGKGMPIPVP